MDTRPVYLKQLELGPMQNFIYLIGDPSTREAAVIDPGWEVKKILAAAEQDGMKLTHVFVTHTHFDHVQGLGELLEAIDLPVYVHEAESASLDITISNIRPVEHGDIIHVGELPITLLHTPGHTPGSQSILVEGRVLTGDTLFVRAVGRWDLPGGDPKALHHSLTHTLAKLPDDTIVYPGHNYAEQPTSTIGREKQQNPFMKLPTVEQFLKAIGSPSGL